MNAEAKGIVADAHRAEIGKLSLKISQACASRCIATIDERTPLLVPSFSSRGIPSVAAVHQLLREYLVETSLVSAYDLHHDLLSPEHVFTTDILFIDSGGYEARPSADPAEPYLDERMGVHWSLGDYQHTIAVLEPLTNLVFISFDTLTSFSEQAELARSFFAGYEAYASDFLCKPTSGSELFVDVDDLILHVDEVASFDILGVTEKELGDSVLNRCRNLLRIREALHRNGHETPIHIFGCLDPVTVLAYFLCGADIFDGLAWLRFAFTNGVSTYHATNIILNGQWAESDHDVVAAHRAQNLQRLRDQARVMRRYSRSHDLGHLATLPAWKPQLLNLIEAVGLDI